MSIKFPDMQILISRTDQIPKIMREGDPTGAGKVAPQVLDELEKKRKKVVDSPNSANIRNETGESIRRKKRQKKKDQKHPKSKLDIRV